jgi:hypothetical protein
MLVGGPGVEQGLALGPAADILDPHHARRGQRDARDLVHDHDREVFELARGRVVSGGR